MPWFPDVLKTALRRAGEIAPSCKEAARLQSHALDRRLKPLEGFGLRFHLLFCKWCRAYGKQISFLSAAAKKNGPRPAKPRPPPSRRFPRKPASGSNGVWNPAGSRNAPGLPDPENFEINCKVSPGAATNPGNRADFDGPGR